MTYKFYKISQYVLYLLTIPSILLWQFGGRITWLKHHPILSTAIFYFSCYLFIFIIYFGIYAYVLKIESVKKTDSPVILIIFGSLLTLLSYGPPIALYFSYPEITIQPLSLDELQRLSEKALDHSQKAIERLYAAKLYYRGTCELTEYVDLNGEKSFYAPDKTDENYLQKRQYIKNRALNRKITAISLLGFAVASCFAFLLFLIWKTRKQKRKRQGKGSALDIGH